MSEYIGISNDKLKHIVGVARKAYSIALERGHDEHFACKCFMLGWVHDVGYEFSAKGKDHGAISADLVENLVGSLDYNSYVAIREHGHYSSNMSEEFLILNMADMQIDSKGRDVGVTHRLDDIKARYGTYSDEYLTCCDLCYRIGLTAINVAGLPE